MPTTDDLRAFPALASPRRMPTGIEATLGDELLRVEPVRPDTVRIRISQGGRFAEGAPDHALAIDPLADAPAFDVDESDSEVVVRTEGLVTTIGIDPFRLEVRRPDGSPVAVSAPDGGAYSALNGRWAIRRALEPDDEIYGLGEKGGAHARRGREFTLWNVDVISPDETREFWEGRPAGDPRSDRRSADFDPYYVSIPFLYHQHGAGGPVGGSFIANAHRAHYDLARDGEYRVLFEGGEYVEYLFAGPRMPEVLERYTELTGRAPLPPLWSLGYHQCRWERYSHDDVLRIARRLREEGVPCDAMWLDIEHMDGYRVFTWDPELFPDPTALARELDELGLRLVTIVDPGVKDERGLAIRDEGLARELFCQTEDGSRYVGQAWPGDTLYPDFTTPEAREWWAELNARHAATGVAGIWNDMNEPATGVIPGDRMRFDHGTAPHGRFHNQYALLMARATREGLLRERPDERPFILSRGGSAGIQRYAANWLGDNQSRWDHLAVSVPMGNGLGISGQPFVGADVGGFAGASEAELFARWMQLAAYTPFFRNHNELDTPPQYPWSFGGDVLDIAREAVRERYRLLPYLYSAFVRATETGEPVQRPLVFDHHDDPTVRSIDDEFLFGRDLLVAPIVTEGARSRSVYLPAGDWYDADGAAHAGGARIQVEVPLERIPVFVRAGAVIPRLSEAPTHSGAAGRPELHLYPPLGSARVESLLVEDDGVSRSGASERTSIATRRIGETVELRGAVAGEGGQPRRLVIRGERRYRVAEADLPVTVLDDETIELTPSGGEFRLLLEP